MPQRTKAMADFSLYDLEKRIGERAQASAEVSYTRQLLDRGVEHCARKLGEEAIETVIAAELDRWAEQGRKAAVALVSLDHGAQLRDTYGQPVMDQLICFVANQWKKYFDIPGSQIVCRLTGTTFVVGCLDLDGGQLAEQMRNIYAEMPHECITSMGMMKRVPFTLSVAVAGLDELDSAANCWQRLYAICDERLRGIQISGGNKICYGVSETTV